MMYIITLNDIAQLLIAGTGVGTLIFTYCNTAKIQHQKNELELHNIAYDIMRKGAKIKEYIDGKFKYYVVRKALWNRINGVIIPECKYAQDSNGDPTNFLVYNEKEEPYRFDIADIESFNKVNDFIKEHAAGVEGLEKIPAQIIDFEEALSCIEENMKYRFSRYERIKFFLQKYVNSLKEFKSSCEKIVNSLNPVKCVKDFANAIQMNEKDEMDVTLSAREINKYIIELLGSDSKTLKDSKKSVDKAYEKLTIEFDKFLKQRDFQRKKHYIPDKKRDSSNNSTDSETVTI